jgi:hypothetical protein
MQHFSIEASIKWTKCSPNLPQRYSVLKWIFSVYSQINFGFAFTSMRLVFLTLYFKRYFEEKLHLIMAYILFFNLMKYATDDELNLLSCVLMFI